MTIKTAMKVKRREGFKITTKINRFIRITKPKTKRKGRLSRKKIINGLRRRMTEI